MLRPNQENDAMGAWMMRVTVIGAAVLLPFGLVAQTGTATDPAGNPMTPGGVNPAVTAPGAPPAGPVNGMGSNAPVTPGGGTMRESLGAPGATGQQMQDRQFVMKAAQGGIAEVELGKLATVKGGPEVKEFGQKMVDDHTAINKDMASVADEMGVMLPKKPSKDDQAEYDKLNGLAGDEFDKEYIAYMLKDHREDMHEFRMEATNAGNADLQAEVMKAGAVIRQHMQMAVKLAQEKGVPVPPRPPRPAAGQ